MDTLELAPLPGCQWQTKVYVGIPDPKNGIIILVVTIASWGLGGKIPDGYSFVLGSKLPLFPYNRGWSSTQ